MPRYFFNVHDGKEISDDEGLELPDLKAARIEAIGLAGRILADDAHRIGLGEDWSMDVEDERGVIVFQLALLAVEAPPSGDGSA